MAKLKMKCPFSDRLCKNCSFYIGRHYLLCYKPEYRGHIKDSGNGRVKKSKENFNSILAFKIPHIETNSFDPFNIDQTDARENVGTFFDSEKPAKAKKIIKRR
jgi:hypothetical protein